MTEVPPAATVGHGPEPSRRSVCVFFHSPSIKLDVEQDVPQRPVPQSVQQRPHALFRRVRPPQRSFGDSSSGELLSLSPAAFVVLS